MVILILLFLIIPGLAPRRNLVLYSTLSRSNTLTDLVPSFTYSGFAIGAASGGATIAQVQGYQINPSTTQRLTGSQLAPINLRTIAVIPPAP